MRSFKRKHFKDSKRLVLFCKTQVAMASSQNRASNEGDTMLKQPSRDKFRGCLAGAVVGDCLGSPFEGMTMGCLKRQTVEDLIGINSKKLQKKENGHYRYTDDTAMARSICKSLLQKKCFDAADLASKFLEDFLKDGDRGYGSGMGIIFDKWKENCTIVDPFLPAKEQFSGSGSYGNGAAMRVAPVALFTSREDDVIKLAKDTALLTHTNKHGFNGAILQALATYNVLYAKAEAGIDKQEFIFKLKKSMSKIEGMKLERKSDIGKSDIRENENEKISHREDFAFTSQLETMESLITDQSRARNTTIIVKHLGNGISAQEAVPAAIFSFAHCSESSFIETLLYAISLGGDTDTIGTMAGALAGAHFGFASIPDEWKRVCEGFEDAVEFADQFYDLTFPE